MRAAFAALALLVAGCGGTPTWSVSFTLAPGAKLSVVAGKGAVRLRNSARGKVEIAMRGEAARQLEGFASVEQKDGETRFAIREDAKDVELEIDIAAPPGTAVACACAASGVEVEGAWGALRVVTAGPIAVRIERADSGELESRGGSIAFEAAAGPTGELRARTAKGNVAIRLPASWTGQVDCATVGGKLDVPPHKSLQTIWDEDKKHVVGRVGPRGGDKVLPTVWAVATHGDVSLRLAD
jgi:hypothetical protein